MLNVKQIIQDSAQVKTDMLDACASDIQKGAQLMVDAAKSSKKILWCGNGGSAADAQHMAAELMGGLVSHDRPPIASIALTTDASFLTAWANDTGYESIFSRQIEGLGEPGDVLIAISTSGNSENVIRGIDSAKSLSMKVIVLTGKSGGKMAESGDVTICIPSDDTQRIQEGHLLAEHILCESVEAGIMES
ncbi:MAG: SIS domain-containing protein [Candidatus Marinimicrobia bacterium]|jgi:D-sedoheptulose 7-phosphate isomerase|nr:SIS domain-containing protein [Candidatus Neomarinimicrobiota bacterium]